jgi:hypothetical protein
MPAITCDAHTAQESVVSDAARGPYPRLTPTAVERAKAKLGISDLDTLATALGFSSMGFYRARVGLFDIRYSHALRVAKQLGWPLARVFDNIAGGSDA